MFHKKMQAISNLLHKKHPKTMSIKLRNGKHSISIDCVLKLMLAAMHKQELLTNEGILLMDTIVQFNGLNNYRPEFNMQCANVYGVLQILAQAMQRNNLLDNSCYAVGLIKLIDNIALGELNCGLTEQQFTRKQASRINPMDIAILLLTLPDDAVDMLINDYVVRSNSSGTSFYSNPAGSSNDKRFSNHWNSGNNKLIGADMDGNISSAWIFAAWDEKSEAYNYVQSFSTAIVDRTAAEKRAVIDKLIDAIYYDNALAVAQLQALKTTFEGNLE